MLQPQRRQALGDAREFDGSGRRVHHGSLTVRDGNVMTACRR
jgi:hypothetical protein